MVRMEPRHVQASVHRRPLRRAGCGREGGPKVILGAPRDLGNTHGVTGKDYSPDTAGSRPRVRPFCTAGMPSSNHMGAGASCR